MLDKHVKLFLAASSAILLLLQSTSAYMMGPAYADPMNPYGYHVSRKMRHRTPAQRFFGTGKRYRYYVRPNSYLSGTTPGGMYSPVMAPRGMYAPGMNSVYHVGAVGPAAVGVTKSMSVSAPMGMGMMMGGSSKAIKNTVRSNSALSHACRADDTNALRQVNCPYMTQHDLHYCITRASEPFLAALARKCKGTFTSNPYQLAAYGVEMILANKPMPFGAIVTRNTCLMMGAYEKKTLLKTAILSRTQNSYAFVDYILETCNIPMYIMGPLQTLALTIGDMSVAMRLQRATMFPVNHNHVQQLVYTPSGRVLNLLNDGALSLMNGRDMAMFGRIGRLCSQLRPEHLTHPLFNPELLNEMNENCFAHLKPRIFWYMSSDMIKRFRWWRSATPAQVQMIPIGRPIQAVPFYNLGQHVYINKLDRYHPCYGITKTQRISIQMEPKTARAFYERCRASGAMAIKASVTLLISAIATYFVFLT